MGLPLSRARLPYDPRPLTAGIVHLGLGGFHRAHMARYTHDLIERDPAAARWGIVGAGLLPGDRPLLDRLAAQDGLYTLVEQDAGGADRIVIGALAGTIAAADDPAALLDRLADPAIAIVSLTVTEHGYCLDRATRTLDLDHPAIVADLATPHAPHSAIGVIVEGLRRRRDRGTPPFTPLSCDNIQDNGAVLEAAVIALAARQEPALADWITAQVRFPGTMVDRITPATTASQIEALAARTGIDDRAPVFCERFRQWVIEDAFPGDRPRWEDVGAKIVADVLPYEKMKLRLLNASHLAVAGLGALMGLETIGDTMAEPMLRGFMRALMDRELEPTLDPVPGIDLDDYKATLIERFANPAIRDTVERVNTDAPVNVLLDPLRDRVDRDEPSPFLALALAAWLRRARGEDEAGVPRPVRHPLAAVLRAAALVGGGDPRPLLAIRGIFGDLAADPPLVELVASWLESLYAVGARETLRRAAIRYGFV